MCVLVCVRACAYVCVFMCVCGDEDASIVCLTNLFLLMEDSSMAYIARQTKAQGILLSKVAGNSSDLNQIATIHGGMNNTWR